MDELVAYLPLLAEGLKLTILLAVSTMALGLVVGMVLASAKLSRHRWLSTAAFAFTNFMRGIPEFLVLLIVYFGGAQLADALLGPGTINVSPWIAGLSALTLVFGAYASETIRGAFQAVPRGQVEAARAYGFSTWQAFRVVQLPQVWRIALPGIGNLWQGSLKDTALVSIVGLDDLMRKSNQAAQTTHAPFTFYMAAALIFLALTLISMAIFAQLERRANRGDGRA